MGNLHWAPQILELLLEHWEGDRFPTEFAKLVGCKSGAAAARLTVLRTEDTTTREETVQNKAKGWQS